jgi:hypothetical protein
MEAKSASTDESTYNQAVIRAVDAAAMKAADSGRDSVEHSPVDHASQAALEGSSLVGKSFDTAYDEVFRNTWYAVKADADTADLLERIYVELCRIEYRDDDSDELVTDGGQDVVTDESVQKIVSADDARSVEPGDRLRIRYESVHGNGDTKTAVWVVDRTSISNHVPLGDVLLRTDGDNDRRSCYEDGSADRKVEFVCDSPTLKSKNGARWQQLSDVATEPTVEVIDD